MPLPKVFAGTGRVDFLLLVLRCLTVYVNISPSVLAAPSSNLPGHKSTVNDRWMNEGSQWGPVGASFDPARTAFREYRGDSRWGPDGADFGHTLTEFSAFGGRPNDNHIINKRGLVNLQASRQLLADSMKNLNKNNIKLLTQKSNNDLDSSIRTLGREKKWNKNSMRVWGKRGSKETVESLKNQNQNSGTFVQSDGGIFDVTFQQTEQNSPKFFDGPGVQRHSKSNFNKNDLLLLSRANVGSASKSSMRRKRSVDDKKNFIDNRVSATSDTNQGHVIAGMNENPKQSFSPSENRDGEGVSFLDTAASVNNIRENNLKVMESGKIKDVEGEMGGLVFNEKEENSKERDRATSSLKISNDKKLNAQIPKTAENIDMPPKNADANTIAGEITSKEFRRDAGKDIKTTMIAEGVFNPIKDYSLASNRELSDSNLIQSHMKTDRLRRGNDNDVDLSDKYDVKQSSSLSNHLEHHNDNRSDADNLQRDDNKYNDNAADSSVPQHHNDNSNHKDDNILPKQWSTKSKKGSITQLIESQNQIQPSAGRLRTKRSLTGSQESEERDERKLSPWYTINRGEGAPNPWYFVKRGMQGYRFPVDAPKRGWRTNVIRVWGKRANADN